MLHHYKSNLHYKEEPQELLLELAIVIIAKHNFVPLQALSLPCLFIFKALMYVIKK
jgi:hypothetical protein